MQKTGTMETSRCITAYKSLKSRRVNFQPLRLFSGIKRIVFSLLRLRFGQRVGKQALKMQGLHSGAQQSALLARVFLSTCTAVRPVQFGFARTLLASEMSSGLCLGQPSLCPQKGDRIEKHMLLSTPEFSLR